MRALLVACLMALGGVAVAQEEPATNAAPAATVTSGPQPVRVTTFLMKHPGLEDQTLVAVMRALDDGLKRNPRLEMKDLDTRLADFAQEVPQEQIDEGRLLLAGGAEGADGARSADGDQEADRRRRRAVEGAALRQEAGARRRDDGARHGALRERRQEGGEAHLRAAASSGAATTRSISESTRRRSCRSSRTCAKRSSGRSVARSRSARSRRRRRRTSTGATSA